MIKTKRTEEAPTKNDAAANKIQARHTYELTPLLKCSHNVELSFFITRYGSNQTQEQTHKQSKAIIHVRGSNLIKSHSI